MKKRLLAILGLVVFIVSLALAQYYYSLYITTRLVAQNGSTVQLRANSNLFAWGTTAFDLGDSATVKLGNRMAGIDSFATTQVIDTLAISGITTTDVFQFTNVTFDYSTAIDSVVYSYKTKTDTCFVYRVKLPYAGGSAVKTAGQYAWVRYRQH